MTSCLTLGERISVSWLYSHFVCSENEQDLWASEFFVAFVDKQTQDLGLEEWTLGASEHSQMQHIVSSSCFFLNTTPFMRGGRGVGNLGVVFHPHNEVRIIYWLILGMARNAKYLAIQSRELNYPCKPKPKANQINTWKISEIISILKAATHQGNNRHLLQVWFWLLSLLPGTPSRHR